MHRLALMLMIYCLALPGVHPNSAAVAAAGRAGEFDYYVLALSWNASWCAAEGDARGAAQCQSQREIGFTLHGLWPQYENGWPEYCTTPERDPTPAETAAMEDIMLARGLAWHQWRKHGRCSGLGPEEYFALAREAWETIQRPRTLRRIGKPLRLAPGAIEQAFIAANPGLTPRLRPGGVTVTCENRVIREVRICLTKALAPRLCGGRTARDCAAGDPLFPPMR